MTYWWAHYDLHAEEMDKASDPRRRSRREHVITDPDTAEAIMDMWMSDVNRGKVH